MTSRGRTGTYQKVAQLVHVISERIHYLISREVTTAIQTTTQIIPNVEPSCAGRSTEQGSQPSLLTLSVLVVPTAAVSSDAVFRNVRGADCSPGLSAMHPGRSNAFLEGGTHRKTHVLQWLDASNGKVFLQVIERLSG